MKKLALFGIHRAGLIAWLMLVLGLIWQRPAAAAPPAVLDSEAPPVALGTEWVRILRDQQQKPLAMEVAVIRYVPAADVAKRSASGKKGPYAEFVDLVGVVHIGDARYYQRLNQRFEQYDALLYELVAQAGTVIEKGTRMPNAHPLGALQNGMKSLLEIEHQLENVDYTKPNFVHADLSPDEFLQSMKDRDEGFLQIVIRLIAQASAIEEQQAAEGESANLEILVALFFKDRSRRLKIALAKQFEQMESLLVGFSGSDGSTLITERNKRALEVLRQQRAEGKKKLAIFYGAGHMSDMHERLVADFQLQPVEIEWLEAWNLRKE